MRETNVRHACVRINTSEQVVFVYPNSEKPNEELAMGEYFVKRRGNGFKLNVSCFKFQI